MLSNLIDQITTWLLQMIETAGYVGIFIITFLENVFTPIPSEAIIPAAGILVSRGEMTMFGAVAAATLGSVAGAYVFYYVGYIMGTERIRGWIVKWGKYVFVTEEDLDRAEKWFAKYEDWAVLIGRVIPLVRSIISIPAGYVKMPLWKFTVLTAIGTAAWSTLLVYIGYSVGENYEELLGVFDTYDTVAYGIIGAGLLYFAYTRYQKWQQRKNTPAE